MARKYVREGRTRSQIGRGSKQKGNAFERWVVNAANPHLEPLGWALCRTPRSGGWFTKNADQELDRLRADITVVKGKDTFPLFLECKAREGHGMWPDPCRRGTWPPILWFLEAEAKAETAGKIPVLIFKRNGVPARVLMLTVDLFEVCGVGDEHTEFGRYAVLPFDLFLSKFVKHMADRKR